MTTISHNMLINGTSARLNMTTTVIQKRFKGINAEQEFQAFIRTPGIVLRYVKEKNSPLTVNHRITAFHVRLSLHDEETTIQEGE